MPTLTIVWEYDGSTGVANVGLSVFLSCFVFNDGAHFMTSSTSRCNRLANEITSRSPPGLWHCHEMTFTAQLLGSHFSRLHLHHCILLEEMI
eukprot:scaffold15461_cov83-Skeletonema_dohrnii-CCMP3373.AAC.2